MRLRVKEWFVLLAVLVSLAGCAKMSTVDQSRLVLTPESGKALVYFVRPSLPARDIRGGNEGVAAIYSGDEFSGFLAPNTHLAVQLSPGKHVFMVIGENTNYLRAVAQGEAPDFVRAELLPNKTYFIKVQPKSDGALVSRFSMEAHNGQFSVSDLSAWTKNGQRQVNNRGQAWAQENASRIGDLKRHFFSKWETRIARDRRDEEQHTLRPESGK